MYESKCKCLTWLKKKKIQKNVELKNNFTLLLLSRGTGCFFFALSKICGEKNVMCQLLLYINILCDTG